MQVPYGNSRSPNEKFRMNWQKFCCITMVLVLCGQGLVYREVTKKNTEATHALLSRSETQISLLRSLQATSGNSSRGGILESYLSDIRRDGLIPHVARKKNIDKLAANTDAILALLELLPESSSPGPFKDASDEFRRYGAIWLDRKNSLMDLYLLGGNYPPGEPTLPPDFIESVKKLE